MRYHEQPAGFINPPVETVQINDSRWKDHWDTPAHPQALGVSWIWNLNLVSSDTLVLFAAAVSGCAFPCFPCPPCVFTFPPAFPYHPTYLSVPVFGSRNKQGQCLNVITYYLLYIL